MGFALEKFWTGFLTPVRGGVEHFFRVVASPETKQDTGPETDLATERHRQASTESRGTARCWLAFRWAWSRRRNLWLLQWELLRV
jgi:hypothetical protein